MPFDFIKALVLAAPTCTIKDTHTAIDETLGAERAAEATRQSPYVMTTRPPVIKDTSEALIAQQGKVNMLLAVGNDPC